MACSKLEDVGMVIWIKVCTLTGFGGGGGIGHKRRARSG